MPEMAANRKDVLTDEVYQVALAAYALEPQDFWYSWLWPMRYKSNFPTPVPEPEMFDIVHMIDKHFERTTMGRPTWWTSRLNEATQFEDDNRNE